MKTIKEMFQEDGQGSMMRSLSFILVAAGIALAFTQPIDANSITLIFGFVGAGLTGKIIQKQQEMNTVNKVSLDDNKIE